MHAFVLQDWTTIRAGTGSNTITQAEPEWLDLEPYQDVAFWVQITEETGTPTPTLTYQTSPYKDESMFLAMATAPTLAVGTAPLLTQVFMLSASVPLARYVRWQLSGTPPWDVAMRIVAAASVPGALRAPPMYSFLLQDWTTIRGSSNVTIVTQAESGWLDLEPYQDIVLWAQVTEITGSPYVALQTAPYKDDGLFQPMLTPGAVGVVTVAVPVLMLTATIPLARYVRWQITQSAMTTWDINFRMMIAANAPGL